MSTKRFGGQSLLDIAKSSAAEPVVPRPEPAPARAGAVPIGELAMKGVQSQRHERVTIVHANAKRCRPWKYHDRHPSWYTRERCLDLIESFPSEGQREVALARRVTGDPDFDFEIIYGMRRRFACEFLNLPLKIEITEDDDARCAVHMHSENADREDITPMERALSFARQLRDRLFETQEQMAAAKNVSKGLVTQMVKAAELMQVEVISKLFPDPTLVPVSGAYKLATRMSDASTREVIVAAARHLGKKAETAKQSPAAILKILIEAPERSVRSGVLKKPYNLGATGQMVLTRNANGKVTLAFPDGINPAAEEEIIATVRRALQDLAK